MGRFISEDPLWGNILDPQSLNRFAYGRNNPFRYTDPTGKESFDDLMDPDGRSYEENQDTGEISYTDSDEEIETASLISNIIEFVRTIFGVEKTKDFFETYDEIAQARLECQKEYDKMLNDNMAKNPRGAIAKTIVEFSRKYKGTKHAYGSLNIAFDNCVKDKTGITDPDLTLIDKGSKVPGTFTGGPLTIPKK